MILALLLACGVDGPLDQPNAPPAPPPMLVDAQPDALELTGVVSDVHAPTRSFVLTGAGKRVIVHLAEVGVLQLAGKAATVADLPAGTTLHVEGRRDGDLLVASRAADTAEEEPAPPVPVAPEVAPAPSPVSSEAAVPPVEPAPAAPPVGGSTP